MTASELALRARMRRDPALLDRAEAVARDAVEWCAIADSQPRERAAHALSRALALAGADVRVYRNVARIQRTRFGDVAAAQHALAAGAAALLAADTQTAEWCALADGWRAAGDPDAALHYLEHARASARTVEDFCAIGDLDRAEVAARTVRDRVEIARACDDAQDLDRLQANLAAGVTAIATVDDAITIARTLQRFGEPIGDAFAAGAARAESARDWIGLARVAPSDREAGRCFERADELADETNRNLVDCIARGLRFRGGARDEATATAVPADLVPWSARTLGWPHDPQALFDLVRNAVPRTTIDDIARNDYGMDYADHLAVLDEIVTTGAVRHPLPWCPLEVLQLERWNEGDEIDHLARAFACTLLCIDDAGPLRWQDGNESTIATLLHSAIALGTEAVDAAIGLFAAMANAYRDDKYDLMRSFAELALVLAAVWRDATDPRIAPLVIRLVHDEARLREDATRWSEGWLLGLTNFDQRHALWRALAAAILAPSVGHDPQLTRLASLLA